jgi:4-hydroxybenzoyl-CoA thioesterase/acyl-CoA thioester hydrolase
MQNERRKSRGIEPMARIAAISADDLHPTVWRTTTIIRFGQCDPAGIVYTPVYFDLFNVAVEEWWSVGLGLDYYATIRERKIGLGYGHASADFFVPCSMGDALEIAIAVAEIGRASFTLTLHGFKRDAEALRGRLVVVTTSLVGYRAVPIPADIRGALEAYRTRCT